MRASLYKAIKHISNFNIIGILGLAGNLGYRIHSAYRFS